MFELYAALIPCDPSDCLNGHKVSQHLSLSSSTEDHQSLKSDSSIYLSAKSLIPKKRTDGVGKADDLGLAENTHHQCHQLVAEKAEVALRIDLNIDSNRIVAGKMVPVADLGILDWELESDSAVAASIQSSAGRHSLGLHHMAMLVVGLIEGHLNKDLCHLAVELQKVKAGKD